MRHADRFGESSEKLKMQFVTLIRSIFQNLKRFERPIHFVILTDLRSSPYITNILDKFIQKDVFEKVGGQTYFLGR